jgi:hypothetical protein
MLGSDGSLASRSLEWYCGLLFHGGCFDHCNLDCAGYETRETGQCKVQTNNCVSIMIISLYYFIMSSSCFSPLFRVPESPWFYFALGVFVHGCCGNFYLKAHTHSLTFMFE